MNVIKVKVNFEKGICDTTGINLITGDYNSTKMVFDFVNNPNGIKVLEMKSPSDNLTYVGEIQNNEVILVGKKEVTTVHNEVIFTKYVDTNNNVYWYDPLTEKIYDNEWTEQLSIDLDNLTVVTEDVSLFNEEGYYVFEISLYGDNSKLTSVHSKIKVKPEQVVIDDEIVTQYLPIFDQLLNKVEGKIEDMEYATAEMETTVNAKLDEADVAINEANTLNIDVNKVDTTTTVTLTKKDGTTKNVNILDGTINGKTTLSIVGGTNIEIVQSGSTLTINNTYDDSEILEDISDLETNKADKSEIPTKTSDITNDSGYITKDVNDLTNYTTTGNMNTAISDAVGTETTNRQSADNNLQGQIDAITSASDVVDVVATYTDLQNYDTSKLTDKDLIKVMQDSTHNNALSYYRWVSNAWSYVGSEGPFYTKSETNTLLNAKQSTIDSSHKLSADLVDDTSTTNKFTNTTEKGVWNAKYDKPSGGIPKNDLSSEVQTNLEVTNSYIKNNCNKLTLKMINNSMGADGSLITTTTRLKSYNIYKADNIFCITPNQGYKYQIYVLDNGIRKAYWNPKNNTLNNNVAWITDLSTTYIDKLKEITTNAYILIFLAKINDSNISSSESNNLNIYFKNKNDIISNSINIFNTDNILFTTDVNNYINKLDFIKKVTLSTGNGQLLLDDGSNAPLRAITNNLYYTNVDITFALANYTAYQNNIFYYDANENFINRTGYTSTPIKIAKGSYFKILLKTVNNDTMTDEILSAILNGATLYTDEFLPNYYTKNEVDNIINPPFNIQKIMNISSSSANPNVTQQSIATDGDNIYVLFPSDSGTNVGVVQVYNKGGLLIKEFTNVPIGHASNTAYYNGKLYVMGFKRKATNFNLVVIDLKDGTYESQDITVGQGIVPKIWDGCSIYGGFLYLIGYDNTAYVTTTQPNTVQCCIISLNDFSTIKFIDFTPPNHNIYTTQGLTVYKNKMYAITSSADNSQAFLQGMNIDIYNLSTNEITTETFTSSQFEEPEGACYLDGYLCTSLVNKGGVYRIKKI